MGDCLRHAARSHFNRDNQSGDRSHLAHGKVFNLAIAYSTVRDRYLPQSFLEASGVEA
ncbi:hypothetical protein [Nostoc sp. UHCC 0870]|uniref:hypothetical protein n=1 Tax=Nostoc sp. UHCC 0870 TaxID=2914041 RepID=UPI001EDE644E|nr:hypothetical protein [Nostoc sp. UHCC 0870]UKO98623.1 hypothetical protein L6494_02475 [Nostoc sp. UHCC 0870]